MRKVTIKLKDIYDIKNFVTIISRYDFDSDLLTGRYIIDAKSIMGILSLNLDKPLTLVMHSEHCEDALKEIAQYIVPEE